MASQIALLEKQLGAKKTFLAACESLTELCEKHDALTPAAVEALGQAGKSAFSKLQARFSNPRYWQAGLDFFLALEFHVPSLVEDAVRWREVAMEEVDEEARHNAKQREQLRAVHEERKHNQGRFSDAVTPVTQAELLAAQGVMLISGEDDRPGMSRDARNALRLVTVGEEDVCVVCQEALPAGSKAKAMPCGHLFHDDCLSEWVAKSNSCPTCRYDDLPSEKKHFDDVERRIVTESPAQKGIIS